MRGRISSTLWAWLKYSIKVAWMLALAKRRRMDFDEYASLLEGFDRFLYHTPVPNGSYGHVDEGIRDALINTAKSLREKWKDGRPGWGAK